MSDINQESETSGPSGAQNPLSSKEQLGETMFKWRDYTAIPLILMLFAIQSPTVISATVGTLMVILGELFRIYSVAFIGAISRTRKSSTGDGLVTSGPFSFVRNPLYIGNFIIVMGFSVFSGHLWFTLIAGILFAFQYYHIVRYEETILLQKFGEEYKAYCEQVPAWIPKKKLSLSDFAFPEHFSTALRSETRTLTTITAVLFSLMLLSK